ncbi:MAG: hypothetical protein QM687_00350 [Ferruginibacter sp.]
MLISSSSVDASDFIISFLLLIFFAVILSVLLSFMGSGVDGSSFSSERSNSSVLLEESLFEKLRRKYVSLAEQYVLDGQYLKASNIHLRLLQNPYKAASILEEGGLYNEAAVIYQVKLSNKQNAAQCYEKGKNYKKAIELYKDLGNKEKSGDLYILLNDRPAAQKCYESLIEDYSAMMQYVKASLVARQKMDTPEKARELLLRGWNSNADSFNCINNYFASFPDHEELKTAIGNIYNTVPTKQKEVFLTALKYEFDKGKDMEEMTRNIAYEIVADTIQQKPSIASEIKNFNPTDKVIIKDIMRYKAAVNRITANKTN